MILDFKSLKVLKVFLLLEKFYKKDKNLESQGIKNILLKISSKIELPSFFKKNLQEVLILFRD